MAVVVAVAVDQLKDIRIRTCGLRLGLGGSDRSVHPRKVIDIAKPGHPSLVGIRGGLTCWWRTREPGLFSKIAAEPAMALVGTRLLSIP